MLSTEQFKKYDRTTIRVYNSWFGGSKLYINGDCRDSSNQRICIDKNIPVLSSSYVDDNGKWHIAEICIWSYFWTVHIVLRIDDAIVEWDN